MKNVNKIFNLVEYEMLIMWIALSGVVGFNKNIISIIGISILTILLIFIDVYYLKNNSNDKVYKKNIIILSLLLIGCYCIITVLPMFIGHYDCIAFYSCEIIYGIKAFKMSNFLLIMVLFGNAKYAICAFATLFIIEFVFKKFRKS